MGARSAQRVRLAQAVASLRPEVRSQFWSPDKTKSTENLENSEAKIAPKQKHAVVQKSNCYFINVGKTLIRRAEYLKKDEHTFLGPSAINVFTLILGPKRVPLLAPPEIHLV